MFLTDKTQNTRNRAENAGMVVSRVLIRLAIERFLLRLMIGSSVFLVPCDVPAAQLLLASFNKLLTSTLAQYPMHLQNTPTQREPSHSHDADALGCGEQVHPPPVQCLL